MSNLYLIKETYNIKWVCDLFNCDFQIYDIQVLILILVIINILFYYIYLLRNSYSSKITIDCKPLKKIKH